MAVRTEIYVFAMLGAFESGRSAASQDTRIGSYFRGAMPAADAAGLPASDNPDERGLRSLFVYGYLDYLKGHRLVTNSESGAVIEFNKEGR